MVENEMEILELYERYRTADPNTIQNNLTNYIQATCYTHHDISNLSGLSINIIYAITRQLPYRIGFIPCLMLCKALNISIENMIESRVTAG